MGEEMGEEQQKTLDATLVPMVGDGLGYRIHVVGQVAHTSVVA